MERKVAAFVLPGGTNLPSLAFEPLFQIVLFWFHQRLEKVSLDHSALNFPTKAEAIHGG